MDLNKFKKLRKILIFPFTFQAVSPPTTPKVIVFQWPSVVALNGLSRIGHHPILSTLHATYVKVIVALGRMWLVFNK